MEDRNPIAAPGKDLTHDAQVPDEMPKHPVVCTIEELAQYLQVPVKTIYYWVSRKRIPYIKVGRHLRFHPEDVLDAFARQTEEATHPCPTYRSGIQRWGNSSLKTRNASPARKE